MAANILDHLTPARNDLCRHSTRLMLKHSGGDVEASWAPSQPVAFGMVVSFDVLAGESIVPVWLDMSPTSSHYQSPRRIRMNWIVGEIVPNEQKCARDLMSS